MERKGAATDVAITGVGVITAVGQRRRAFEAALKEGRHAFRVMERPGRQKDSAFIGAELPEIKLPAVLSSRVQRTASLSAQAAMVTVHEAWQDANLDCVDPYRIGLIIGGSNCQQRELTRIHDEYAARMRFLRPMATPHPAAAEAGQLRCACEGASLALAGRIGAQIRCVRSALIAWLRRQRKTWMRR